MLIGVVGGEYQRRISAYSASRSAKGLQVRGFLEGPALDTCKRVVPHGLRSELVVAPALGLSSSGAVPPAARSGQVVATQVATWSQVTLDNVAPHRLFLVEHGGGEVLLVHFPHCPTIGRCA